MDKDGALSHSWDVATKGEYKSVTQFAEKGSSSAADYVIANSFNYKNSSSNKGQSAMLIERRMIFTQDVISWETEILAGRDRATVTADEESQWPSALWNAVKQLGANDRKCCKAFMNVSTRFPFIMRLNDDRTGARPLNTLSILKLSAAYMTRIDGVIAAFIFGA